MAADEQHGVTIGKFRGPRHRRRVVARAWRAVVRIGAAGTLLGVLVVVPLAVTRLAEMPLGSVQSWRELLTSRRIDERAAIAAGAVVFMGLWAWFALTAVAECWTIVRWRLTDRAAPLPEVPPGPTGWLRSLVRVAVLAGAALGASTSMADLRMPATATALAAGIEVVVDDRPIAGAPRQPSPMSEPDTDSPGVVQAPLPDLMIDHDSDGRIDRPFSAPSMGTASRSAATMGTAPVGTAPVGTVSTAGHPTTREMLSAVMFAAGAVALLDSARRRRLRSAPLGSRPALPSLAQVRTEMMLRSLAADEQMTRLDVALRAVSNRLASQGVMALVAVVGRLGEIRLLPSCPAPPSAPWREAGDGWWSLPATVTLEELSAESRTDAPPCPAMVHLGATDSGECFVDLEAVGVLELVSTRAPQVMQSLAAALSVSPFLASSRVVAVAGVDDALGIGAPSAVDAADAEGPLLHSERDDDGPSSAVRAATLDDALEIAAAMLGDTLGSIGDRTTFEQRVATRGAEAFEPVVVLSPVVDDGEVEALRRMVSAGRGVGAVVAGAPTGAALRALASPGCDRPQWRLRQELPGAELHVLEPCGIRIRPAVVSAAVSTKVGQLIEAESTQLDVAAPVVPISAGRLAMQGESMPYVEPEWALMVRTLGAVEVITADGAQVQFDRSKAMELVVWLALHRRRPTRGAARAALWDLDVRDATFANVVSEARRAMARAALPEPGEEWIPRTLTDSLPLHERVVSDAELLEARVRHSAGLPHREAIDVLTPGLEVVTGMPFAGSSYLWCDAEGHASALVLLVVGAATKLAQHHLALGDVEGVFWATGQGLLVLSGHEELVSLRMRAHASAGDLAGVRDEWERYERALQADPWSAAQPSPKLATLRRELLGRVS